MDGRPFSLFTKLRHATKSDLATCDDKSQPGWRPSLSLWERGSGGWQSVGAVHALVPPSYGREEKEDLEEEKQKRGNKNSTSPPMLFPSAMLWRERMSLWVPNRSERRQMADSKAGGEAGYAFNHPTRRKQIQCVAQERRRESSQTLQESEGSCIFRWNLLPVA